jgi:hypothetical protein
MKKEQADEWQRNHDMPHEHIMDLRGIDYSALNESIQRDIREYDDVFDEALEDGYIDQEEEKELVTASFKIYERIKKEHLKESLSTESSGGLVLGILSGIGIAAAAIFGLNQIRE